MAHVETEIGGRGSKELWLTAACEVLLESGIDSVRIQTVATKLNLSRTSFYWFFKDREELLDQLLALWRDKNTGNFVAQANAYAETLVEAVLNVSDCWFDSGLFDPKFEFAVRSWALQSTKTQAAVQDADEQRLRALRDLFQRFGLDDVAADVRAHTIYLTQIGYISMQVSEDFALRLRRLPTYVEIFTGHAPSVREMERFRARHPNAR